MPKKWKTALEEELTGKSQSEQQQILNDAARELRDVAKANNADEEQLVQIMGRKVG